MKTNFDTNAILFQLLDGKTSINGGVYVDDERPDGSFKEDIVINALDVPQVSLPQVVTSNVNVYTADTTKKIGGEVQLSANSTRLKALTDEVLAIIRNANITGLKLYPGNVTMMNEPNTKQHFVNIRVNWNIQID